MNSITKKEFNSIRRYAYVITWFLIFLAALAYGGSYGANVWIDHLTVQQQDQLNQVQARVIQLGSERAFFSYDFAKKITANQQIKRSEHIQMLITVLNEIQNNNYVGANAIQLSDFTISPTSISLKGKVVNLLLLYYSSQEKNYTSVIDRFTNLPFISNLKIQNYTKVGDYYEFVLTADINLNATLQPNTDRADTTNGTGETNSSNQ